MRQPPTGAPSPGSPASGLGARLASQAWAYVWALALLAGSGVRIEQYATRRSLWLDEAMLASNLVSRDLRGLARPLAHEQGAPIGWLWLQRGALVAFGQNEYSLRLVAVVAGLGAILVIPMIAYRAVGRWAAAGTAVLVGSSPIAIRYSAEVKQYSSDLFVASLLVLLAVVIHDHADGGWAIWAWGSVCALSVWFSHPAVFVVAATTCVLLAAAARSRDLAATVRLAAASVLPGVSFAILYLVSLRALAGDSYLRRYWAAAMGPRPLSIAGLAGWFTHVIPALMSTPGNLGHPLLALGLVAAGLAVLVVTRRSLLAPVLLVLLVVAITAASADRYPLSGRLALYLVIALFLPLAVLVDWSAEHLRRPRPIGVVSLGLVALVVAAPLRGGVRLAARPFSTPDTRAVLQFVAAHRLPKDQLWVQWPEIPVAQYYARTVGVDADHEVDDGGGPGSGGCGGQTPTDAAVGGRVWLVIGYRLSTAAVGERAAIVDAFGRRGTLLDQAARRGAVAYLFDFGAGPTLVRPLVDPGLQCLTVRPLDPVAPSGLHTGPLGSGKAV